MFKFFKELAFAALVFLAVGWPVGAQASHTAIVGSTFTAVDQVSTALRVATLGDTVSIHINGVYDMVVELQKEVGSPGSGAWATIPGFKDIAPAANTQYRIGYTTETANESIRLRVTTDTSGTLVYSMFDGRLTPRTFSRTTHVNGFDDFYANDIGTTGDATFSPSMDWTYFIHTDGTPFDVLVSIQEGAGDMTSGTGGTIAADVTAVSGDIVANSAALISDGVTAVEWRVKSDNVGGQSFGFGLSGVVAIADAIALFTIDSNLVTDTAATNDIAIMFSTDADGLTVWQSVSTNAGNVGNNDDEWACANTVAANTYYRLRIEIEATGDAFFFVDGNLCGVEALAIATTARLIPYAWATSATDTTTGGAVIIVDYVDFYMARPSD